MVGIADWPFFLRESLAPGLSRPSFAPMTEFGDVSHLLPPSWKSIVTTWFQEDCPSFDYGGLVVGETPEIATLYGKSKVRNSIVEPCLIGCLGNIGRSTIF